MSLRLKKYFTVAVFAALGLAIIGLAGCDSTEAAGIGSDDGGLDDAVADADQCPSASPKTAELSAPCCYRKSNNPRKDSPEFRVTGLHIDSLDVTLGSPVINDVIQTALNSEEFNWLLQLEEADGPEPLVRTGFGARNDDDTFAFTVGLARAPGLANRWDPIEVTGALELNQLEFLYDGDWILPVGKPESPIVELPLHGISVAAKMSVGRSCIGTYDDEAFDLDAGSITTFITIEGASSVEIQQPPIMDNLCDFIAKVASCEDMPQVDWQVKPDSLCGLAGCVKGECDPDVECNAWELKGSFSAAGVEIHDVPALEDGGVGDSGPDKQDGG